VDALRALDEERATDDPLNGLILSAGLSWRDVEVLRTLRNTCCRSGPTGTRHRERRPRRNPWRRGPPPAFAARFDPALAADRTATVGEADAGFARALEAVRSLAETSPPCPGQSRGSALRTNAYQRPERPVFSVKMDCRRVEGMPSPRPLFEVYVHSRRLEGIHLRGGMVARGGIRCRTATTTSAPRSWVS